MELVHSSLSRALFGLLLASIPIPGFFGAAVAADIAFVGAKIYPAPGGPPIENGVIVVSGDKITSIGSAEQITIPENAKSIGVDGKVITAGLWNSHVHFNLPPLESIPDDVVTAYVRDMLLQYGFVHVLDTGSAPGVTQEVRRRVESGAMLGPSILIAGGSLVPKGASPFYLRPNILPDAAQPDAVQAQINLVQRLGGDGIKIYAGSIVSATERSVDVVPMDVEVVTGVTTAAHDEGMFVIAHPSNITGAWAAINGGVDILAHAFPQEDWDRSILTAMLERDVALIPTLKMWRIEGENFGQLEAFIVRTTKLAQEQLNAFTNLGGQVLFGTDVGYITDFDPTDEYALMQKAGLSFAQILESLTTAPARRFGVADKTGRLEAGLDADLVVLEADPAADITAFASPALVIRRGETIFER
ncbi:MAG: amidohydrolase family protein [Rhodospirillaceae bacterium]|nr:amidohydrolase family protein [Rhodospirillaceae bacterium]MBT5565138.1 amidohydrolase family protein [Rhodospirillaceae bacterium]MBT6088160.1 amidohydrolase family protein [Rhodospirillaceae bacterium]MBT6962243.1 amidohydrolase family protein [Rhodospirillaceae bacterium]